eukprot:364451-Chlamydomonas_euryale.AAC.7
MGDDVGLREAGLHKQAGPQGNAQTMHERGVGVCGVGLRVGALMCGGASHVLVALACAGCGDRPWSGKPHLRTACACTSTHEGGPPTSKIHNTFRRDNFGGCALDPCPPPPGHLKHPHIHTHQCWDVKPMKLKGVRRVGEDGHARALARLHNTSDGHGCLRNSRQYRCAPRGCCTCLFAFAR